MKKVLIGSAVAVLAVSASAQEVKMPTIYGQVNKAILYTSQKKEMGYSKMSNLVDVKNSESRLGAKGTYEVNTLKVNYYAQTNSDLLLQKWKLGPNSLFSKLITTVFKWPAYAGLFLL